MLPDTQIFISEPDKDLESVYDPMQLDSDSVVVATASCGNGDDEIPRAQPIIDDDHDIPLAREAQLGNATKPKPRHSFK